jgi:hypothetical protein
MAPTTWAMMYGNYVCRFKAAASPEPNRYRTVKMPAGDVADSIGHRQHSQSKGKADPKEANAPSVGKPAASTALPQPANVNQKVPKNSAPMRRDIFIIPSPSDVLRAR